MNLTPLQRALLSLSGLAAGDAFGEQFFGRPENVSRRIAIRDLPPAPWHWTDDTAMACSIVRTLRRCGSIDQDVLAEYFAAEYASQPNRGYGGMAHSILRQIGSGVPWKSAAGEAFDGLGSYGNGGAMRAAPIGAFFADDPAKAAEQGRLSAEVTHAHPEGIVGGIAIAAAAAWAASNPAGADGSGLLAQSIALTPESEVRTGIQRALRMGFERDPQYVAAMLGSGSKVSAPDTVPFALWCAAKCHGDFSEAMWTTAAGFGDVDTTCAIVGGIVVLSCGEVPKEFVKAREPLPADIQEF